MQLSNSAFRERTVQGLLRFGTNYFKLPSPAALHEIDSGPVRRSVQDLYEP
jgi:hypothetical protein